MQHRLAFAGAITWLIVRMAALFWGLDVATSAFVAPVAWAVIVVSFAVGVVRSDWFRPHSPEFAGLTELILVLWAFNLALLALS